MVSFSGEVKNFRFCPKTMDTHGLNVVSRKTFLGKFNGYEKRNLMKFVSAA